MELLFYLLITLAVIFFLTLYGMKVSVKYETAKDEITRFKLGLYMLAILGVVVYFISVLFKITAKTIDYLSPLFTL